MSQFSQSGSGSVSKKGFLLIVLLGVLEFCASFPSYQESLGGKIRFIHNDEPKWIGTGSSVCSLPADVGPCRAAFPRFYYEQGSGQCTAFIYGGCQGNGNNFLSVEQCKAACT